MNVPAVSLLSYLHKVKIAGSSTIDTPNVVLYSGESNNIILTTSNGSTIAVVKTDIIVDNDFTLSSAISVPIQILISVLTSCKANKVDITLRDRFIILKTSTEVYEVAFTRVSTSALERLKAEQDIDTSIIMWKDIPLSYTLPLTSSIKNILTICPDGKYRMILYNDIVNHHTQNTCILVTSTTMEIIRTILPDGASSQAVIDTKTNIIPNIILRMITLDNKASTVSMWTSDKKMRISIGDITTVTALYVSPSIQRPQSIVESMENTIRSCTGRSTTITMKTESLLDIVKKAVIILNKDKSGKMKSYLPFIAETKNEIKTLFSCSYGSYTTSVKDNITLEDSADMERSIKLDLHLSIMESILSTISSLGPNGHMITITMKKSSEDDDKIYITFKPTTINTPIFYMRLKR